MPKQDVGVQLYYDGSWHDLVGDGEVFAQPIVITQGLADESGALRPASVTLQLDNATDKYRPTNPQSSLYGRAGRNAPLRVQVGTATRAVVELSSVVTDQTQDFRQTPARGRAWADVQAGGLLQRVNQWSKPIRSAFYRHNSRLANVVGYWPGEQDRGSTALFSPTTGTRQAVFRDIAPDSQYRPPSSAPLLDFGASSDADTGSEMGAYFAADPGGSDTAGWQISWAARYGQLVPGEQDVFDWGTRDANGIYTAYGLYLDSTTGQILIYSARDGVGAVLAYGASYSGWNWNDWTLIDVDASYSAGTTTIYVNWCNADNSANGFITTSFTGEPHRLSDWNASRFAGVPENSTMGHIVGVNVSSTGGTDLFSSGRRTAFAAHTGERASYRFARLCAEEGIAYYVGGQFAASYPLGPQGVDTLPNLFKEIAATDDGLIYDVLDEAKLQYLSRADRYRRTPALTLTPTDFPALPREVFDDKGLWNVVTARQRDGGEYTVSDDTSALGTQDPPDGVGEKRQDFDVSVADEVTALPQVANWWLRRGTVDLPRFPQLTLDLNAVPALVAAVDVLRVGDVVEITGFRENTIRLHVLGWTETIGTHTRTITFNCAADQQFVTGVWDATDSRWDSATHTLKTGVNTTATSVTFRSLSSKVTWSASTPYDVFIAGERLTVTAMGAPSLVGGGYDQVATVTRSVNGIVKSLTAGAPIHIATPGRWAL